MVDYSLKMTTFARNIKTRIKAIKKNMAQEDVFKKIVSQATVKSMASCSPQVKFMMV